MFKARIPNKVNHLILVSLMVTGSVGWTRNVSVRPTSAGCSRYTLRSGRTLRFCVQPSESSNPHGVIYFFHGSGGSEQDIFTGPWQVAYAQVKWTLGERMPDVVSISFGSETVIARASRAAVNPQLLAREFFPYIERNLGYAKRPQRLLLGVSMGGFNALNVAATNPRGFRSVILLCPALLDFNPFDQNQVNDYVRRHGELDINTFQHALAVVHRTFGNAQNWESSNPIEMLFRGVFGGLAFFLSAGQSDQYGFFEGASAFANGALNRNIPILFAPVSGGHCSFSEPALLNYLNRVVR